MKTKQNKTTQQKISFGSSSSSSIPENSLIKKSEKKFFVIANLDLSKKMKNERQMIIMVCVYVREDRLDDDDGS